jgi:hypothetical protein
MYNFVKCVLDYLTKQLKIISDNVLPFLSSPLPGPRESIITIADAEARNTTVAAIHSNWVSNLQFIKTKSSKNSNYTRSEWEGGIPSVNHEFIVYKLSVCIGFSIEDRTEFLLMFKGPYTY